MLDAEEPVPDTSSAGMIATADAEEPVSDTTPAGMITTASNAGLEVARDLLLQGCRLSSTQWQPGNVLMCAAWTLIAACLPQQPDALQHALQQIDEENLDLALHGLQRCVSQAPPAPALWPDTFLWWYLLIAAKVWHHHELHSHLAIKMPVSQSCIQMHVCSFLFTLLKPLKMCRVQLQKFEKKRQDKTTPFGVNLVKSQVLHWAAQLHQFL